MPFTRLFELDRKLHELRKEKADLIQGLLQDTAKLVLEPPPTKEFMERVEEARRLLEDAGYADVRRKYSDPYN